MPITIELVKNNDPRFYLGIPVLDIYLDEPLWAKDVGLDRIQAHISAQPIAKWLDECNAAILCEERFDVDLDVCVLVCHAIVDESQRIWHAMSADGRVPMVWEHVKSDATP